MHPDFLLAGASPFVGLAVLCSTDRRSLLDTSPRVLGFVRDAIADTRNRLAEQVDPIAQPTSGGDVVRSIVDWARATGVRQVVTRHIPVGPTADLASVLRADLAAHDIALIAAVRRWDQLTWRHATRGFFQFREKIPAVLAEMANSSANAA